MTGFEPATSWSQTRRSSQAEPHPGVRQGIPVFPRLATQKLLYTMPLLLSTGFQIFFRSIFPQPPPRSSKIIKEFFLKLLEFQKWIDYNIDVIKKEQPPHTRGWPITKIEIPPSQRPSIQGWFFYAHFWDLKNATD